MIRRDFCKISAATAVAIGMAGPLSLNFSPVEALVGESDSAQVGRIYQLQAAFHRAKSTQDLDLMMSLWDVNGILYVQGDPNSPYVGFERLRAFWQHSGSFTNRRFSLVPSFKIQIEVHGDHAFLYFECHDVGNFDLANRFIAADTFLAGTLRKKDEIGPEERETRPDEEQNSKWVFSEMTAGRAAPLSVDHYYFP